MPFVVHFFSGVLLFSFFFPIDPAAPSPPINFSLSTVPGNSTVLEARWEEPEVPNGILRNYTVRCNDTLEFPVATANSTDVVVTSLTGLTAFTVYECLVYATTDGGQGNSSESSVATTAEYGKVKVLDILYVGKMVGQEIYIERTGSWEETAMKMN